MEGNIVLSYQGSPRVFGPEAIGARPPVESVNTPRLAEKIRGNLGRLAATTLCAIAANGALSTDSAARQTEASSIEGQGAIAAQNQNHTHRLRIRECGDPPEDAPIRRQLRTMRCLHALIMPNPRATSGSSLTRSAQRKTRSILKPDCKFSHQACDRPFDAFIAKKFLGRGENLAWGTGRKGSAQKVFDSWMHSTSHREAILNKRYDRFGIAMRRRAKKNYWTAHFGDLHTRKR